ncbi:MAG: WD40 repeat domain-containing protein [Methylobacter sp.]
MRQEFPLRQFKPYRRYFYWMIFILLISLSLLSIYSKGIHKDFLTNFSEDSKTSDNYFESLVVNLKYDDKEKYLVVGHESGKIDIWDAKEALSKREIKAHEHRANLITFTSDGNSFFSNSYFETSTKLWSAKTGELLHLIPDTRGPVCATPNENIYLIANNEYIRFFDNERKLLLPEKYVLGGVVTAMATDIASELIAIGTASGSIEVWQFSENKEKLSIRKISSVKPYDTGNWIVGLQFSSNGKNLYSVARSGSIDEWTIKTFEKRRSIGTPLKHINSVAFLQASELLALGGTVDNVGVGDSFVEVISLSTEKSSIYIANTKLTIVEFIPPLAKLIASQYKSTKVLSLPPSPG